MFTRLLALPALGLLSGCYQPKEGCLDIDAVNYQVDADNPCDGCCKYPVLRVNFQHKIVLPDTTENLAYGKPYSDGAGNRFYLKRIRFYLSDFRLLRADGEEVGVESEVELRIVQPAGDTVREKVENNFALVNPGDFRQKSIGAFRSSGAFNRVRFTIGLSDKAQEALPTGLPADHPLSVTDLYRESDHSRLYNRIELYRVPSPSDTLYQDLQLAGAENRRTVELPVSFFLDPGFNPKIVLRVDYLSWFQNVDLVRDSEAEILRKIVNKLTDSFSLVEIVAEEQ